MDFGILKSLEQSGCTQSLCIYRRQDTGEAAPEMRSLRNFLQVSLAQKVHPACGMY